MGPRKRTVIIDIEANGLQPDRIWCIVCKDVNDGTIKYFRADNVDFIESFNSFARTVGVWIGHSIISYDSVWVNKLFRRFLIDPKKCIDTLIVSRLINYNKQGGHSVENWGRQFGMTKKFIPSWDDPDKIPEYLERCKYDVEIQYRIYKELRRFIEDKSWAKALRVEHELQIICQEMHENGFAFDKDRAEALLDQIKSEMGELEKEIRADIPPVLVQDGPIKLKVNKDGTTSKRTLENVGTPCSITDGSSWYRYHYEPFNPGSPKQRIEYLNSVGWKPTEKTKGHIQCERQIKSLRYILNKLPTKRRTEKYRQLKELEEKLEKFRRTGWKVNETNLNTLPRESPVGARHLAAWLTLDGRRGDLEEWLGAYLPSTGRIHGTFNGIGSWTHRMSHVRPNQGNIFSNFTPEECKGSVPTGVEDVKLRYNGKLRGLWRAGTNRLLVGTDAEGIQMRVLAHLINDPEYTEAIVNGRKEDETDVHNLNRKLLGSACRSRQDAKTFIYAFLLGAGTAKVAEILGCNQKAAREAVENFVQRTPGLAELKRHRIPSDARRGYFVGLDGRKVICKSEHLMLSGYLQNGEKVVMAHANVLWRNWADEEGLTYKQIDFVHDEWVSEVYHKDEAHELGKLQAKAIEQTGVDLGLNCALAGEYKIGKDWLEVH